MKLALDVMGFENDLSEAIKATKIFLKRHSDVEVILVGQAKSIKPLIAKMTRVSIFDAQGVISMTDDPLFALRKTDSSMYQAISLVQKNHADGVLSAGNTNCYVPLVYTLLGLLPKIKKPAFMPTVPTVDQKQFLLIDVGANKTVSAEDLVNFAKMANVYAKAMFELTSPKIGLINIGTESHKGFSFQQEANEVLKKDKHLNYVGFIEPRNLIQHSVDIAVCDGYTGNLVLKSMEGSLKALSVVLKQAFRKPWNWLGALLSLNVINHTKKTFDYKNHAGAMVIGLNKPAVKTHGSADCKQFLSSLEMLYELIEKNVISQIKKAL